MAKRKSEKPSNFERTYNIIQYLKRNSDSEHTATQASLRKVPELEEYIGNKQTFNRMIKCAAMAMNYCGEVEKPEDEWNIIFDDFVKQYGYDEEEIDDSDDDDESKDMLNMHIKGLFYHHIFSYDDINSLIEGILFSKTLDSKTADKLINKIENNLTTKFYKKGPKKICKIQESQLVGRDLMRENLLIIQEAIDNNVQISFQFNGYNYRKKLEPVREERDVVSPYYIIASEGRYYLIACREIHKEDKIIRNMSIWRIDLMTDIDIPGKDERLKISGIHAVPKSKVENLPQEWKDDFQLSHLNMSFDKPVTIKLRIKSSKTKDDPIKRVRADYTFLHDWFGDTFRYIKTEKTEPYDDIVQVVCSPYGMVNWALQYSNRVEVLEPEYVRNEIVKKVKLLTQKYL
ncbi:WYL domain-containing protein [Haloimpatiens sp. FM7315]|uniref:WYL domain-containing protein n=1 Tax=Haloimpatiens sp. FM7315 TaxID=3298609 RepID=UPI0035A2E5C6